MYIHQIWLNNTPLPNHVNVWSEKCSRLGDYKLWTKNDYQNIVPDQIKNQIQDRFASSYIEHLKCASDFMRLYILLEYGGCYLDIDFEPVNFSDDIIRYLYSQRWSNNLNVTQPWPDRRPCNGMIWTLDIHNKHLKMLFDFSHQMLEKKPQVKKALSIAGPPVLEQVIPTMIANRDVIVHQHPVVAVHNDPQYPPQKDTLFVIHQRDWRPRRQPRYEIREEE